MQNERIIESLGAHLIIYFIVYVKVKYKKVIKVIVFAAATAQSTIKGGKLFTGNVSEYHHRASYLRKQQQQQKAAQS